MRNQATKLLFILTLPWSCWSWSPKIPPSPQLEIGNFQKTRRESFVTAISLATPAFFFISSCSAVEEYQEGPRGLKYLVTKQGNGNKPQRGQKVKTSYTLYVGGFPDDSPKSQKIDSSKGLLGDRPFEFNAGVSQVIKGWDLALLDMKEGEARKLIIPSELGYGEKGAGGKIPGGATLYFEVELTGLNEMPSFSDKQLQWLENNPL